jgi:diadenosine tetraphosphate (Ap4A) HIT family hydrolase
MHEDCFICDRIETIKQGTNPYFVKELSTGYVVLGDNQYYKGLTFFLSKKHASELHEVPREWRDTFLSEMADTAAVMHRAFKPRKINYELLGNRDNHLHWWLIPRHNDDPEPGMPIWVRDKQEIFGESSKPTPEELKELVTQLQAAFNHND